MVSDIRVLNIATGDPSIIIDAVDRMNESYKSDFTYLYGEDRDGVEFGVVDVGESTNDQVYLLGFFIGSTVQELRIKGAIDW